ncbi:MAG: hypothetical protein COB85_08200, partial [Bacteroidetes bacterium]
CRATLAMTVDRKYKIESRIIMGNDEFILHIRKTQPECAITNEILGKKIWIWIKDNDPSALQVEGDEDMPCHWGDTGGFIADTNLPKTACQFEFNCEILPRLYCFLSTAI